MSNRLTREELKRNELGDAVGAGFQFAGVHLRAILVGLGGIVAAAIALWGLFLWQQSRAEAANRQLGEALKIAAAAIVAPGAQSSDPNEPSFATTSARDGRARELFEVVVRDHGSTGAGNAARLWLADLALSGNDPATARRLWTEYLDANSRGLLAAAARRNLIRLDRAEGKSEELLEDLQAALEQKSDPLPVDALLWELAETFSALGRAADAQGAYRRLVDEQPSSPFADEARRALAEAGSAV